MHMTPHEDSPLPSLRSTSLMWRTRTCPDWCIHAVPGVWHPVLGGARGPPGGEVGRPRSEQCARQYWTGCSTSAIGLVSDHAHHLPLTVCAAGPPRRWTFMHWVSCCGKSALATSQRYVNLTTGWRLLHSKSGAWDTSHTLLVFSLIYDRSLFVFPLMFQYT